MDFARHLAALRHEGDAFVAAAATGLANDVPSCPGWTVRDLAAHVAHEIGWTTRIVRTHADAEVPEDHEAVTTDPVEAAADALAELVETLTNEGPDSPCWNWSDDPRTAAFWARRMANELAVHRWDAELATTGRPNAIEPELAADTVAESLEVILAYHLPRQPQDGLHGTFRIEATDTGDVWTGTLRPDHVELGGDARADRHATLRGTASSLALALWGRAVPVEAHGDEQIVRMFTT